MIENPLWWVAWGPFAVIWTFLTMESLSMGQFLGQSVLGAVGTGLWITIAGAFGIVVE
ncbi:hypothetical protein [Salinigranum rubrum]|uniref:hypothetical protein n=1 Tax=Salinigranum rubrum TaxID=755307 RepID=UPI0013A5AC03|nr:hypothetical protein [Salinigranum rubrum]